MDTGHVQAHNSIYTYSTQEHTQSTQQYLFYDASHPQTASQFGVFRVSDVILHNITSQPVAKVEILVIQRNQDICGWCVVDRGPSKANLIVETERFVFFGAL